MRKGTRIYVIRVDDGLYNVKIYRGEEQVVIAVKAKSPYDALVQGRQHQ